MSNSFRLERRDLLLLVGPLLLAAWAQRHAIGAFFSPDDLIHLEQAAGLRPTLPSPFRVLSQVLYFRAMYALAGPNPLPFHLVTYLLHLANAGLAYALARSFAIDRLTAAVQSG